MAKVNLELYILTNEDIQYYEESATTKAKKQTNKTEKKTIVCYKSSEKQLQEGADVLSSSLLVLKHSK